MKEDGNDRFGGLVMRRLGLLALGCVVLVALGGSPAEAQGNRYKAWFGVTGVAPLSDEEAAINGPPDTIELSTEIGGQLGFEWREKWWGIALDYTYSTHDVEGEFFDKIGEIDRQPIALSGYFHLVHTRFLNFYFGPTVEYVFWSDIDLDMGGTVKADDSFGYGLSLGVDLSLVKLLAIVIDLRYMIEDVGLSGGQDVAVNPLGATVGLAFRWGKRD